MEQRSQEGPPDSPTVICVTTVKNEAWIMADFLAAASEWADIIIVGDNGSDDDTHRIAASFEKVELCDVGASFNEFERRLAVLERARRRPGRKVVFDLDADEMLSANWRTSPEWQFVRRAPIGTRFWLDWVEILPPGQEALVEPVLFGYVDDGTAYTAPPIHSPRVPPGPAELDHKLEELKVLHLALVDLDRHLAKHRYYKCVELIEHGVHPIDACINYQAAALNTYGAPFTSVSPRWTDGLPFFDRDQKEGAVSPRGTWFDAKVLDLLMAYGPSRFRKLNIWHADWTAIADALGRPAVIADPRSPFERIVHRAVERHRTTLKYPRNRRQRLIRRAVRYGLRPLGW